MPFALYTILEANITIQFAFIAIRN